MKLFASLVVGVVLVAAPAFAEDSANVSASTSDHVLRADQRDGRAAMREGMRSWRADRPAIASRATAGRSFTTDAQVSQTAATQNRGS